MSADAVVADDPVVRAALRLLPVPDHIDGFWDDLEAELFAELDRTRIEPALAVGPPRVRNLPGLPDDIGHRRAQEATGVAALATATERPDPALLLVPAAMRRRSNLVLLGLALVATVVVAVAGLALVRNGAATGGAADARTDEADRTSQPPVTAPAIDPAAPTAAVLEWVRALSTGDAKAAWALLGPASRAHVGSQSAFAAQSAELAGRVGPWAATAPTQVIVTRLPGAVAGELVVVTFVGTEGEGGARHRRAEAFPVRMADGSVLVEALAPAGELELVTPATGPPDGSVSVVRTGDALVVVVPRGVAAPVVRVGDGAAQVCGTSPGTSLAELDNAPGQRCSYRPAAALAPGRHVLTVAFSSADGSAVSAAAVLFEVA